MSEPAGVTAVYDNVVIWVYGDAGSRGFGIRGASVNARVGTVYGIGSNVYRISIGQKVGFEQRNWFATDASDDSYAVVSQDAILITYTTPP